MKKSILIGARSSSLPSMLAKLNAKAASLGMTNTAWAACANVRKETLSRLKRRNSCDFATLEALAGAVGVSLEITEPAAWEATADGRFPVHYGREYEALLVELCGSRRMEPQRWRALGPAFFMAGLAVTLASLREFDRRAYLALAEELHPGSSSVAVYALWLRDSPARPSRFVPMLLAARRCIFISGSAFRATSTRPFPPASRCPTTSRSRMPTRMGQRDYCIWTASTTIPCL